MSSSGAYASFSSIPGDDLKTVRYIKEITEDHSDEDISAMLKECAMDPAETIHRLSQLDTYHTVKSKRDKRKEKFYRVPDEPGRRQEYQGRGSRSGCGNGPSRYISQDTGSVRNSAVQRENESVESRGRGVKPSPLQLSKDAHGKANNLITKSSSVLANGPAKVPIDITSAGHGAKLLNVPNVSEDNTLVGAEKQRAEQAPSASDPILVSSLNYHLPTLVGAIKREAGMHFVACEPATSVPANQLHPSQDKPPNPEIQQNYIAEGSEIPPCPNHENGSVGPTSNYGTNPGKSGQSEVSLASEAVTAIIEGCSSLAPSGSAVEEETSRLGKLKFSDGQHVIIPNHIQVPESIKNVLSFGSFGASTDVGVKDINNSASGKSSDGFADPLSDEPSPRQDAPATVQEVNSFYLPQAQSAIPDKTSILEGKVPSAAILQEDRLKVVSLPAFGPPYPNVHPSCNFFMPTMLGSPLLQIDGLDSQAHQSNSMGVNLRGTSTTPPPSQSAAVGQSSISLQHVPLIRQPYASNFFPYGNVFPPFYMPPTRFFGQGGFLPQMATANMYLTPQAVAAGMKVSPASFKQGTNSGNQAPLGTPYGFRLYGPQVGFSTSPAGTSGDPNTINEDVPPSLENNIYVGNLNVGSWMQTAGRDASTLLLNSFFNLPPQPDHRCFPVYPPFQPMAAPSAAGHPPMQLSQSMAGSVESVGPPYNVYHQQPQRQKMNWSSNI